MLISKFKKHFIGVVFSLITLLFCQSAWSEEMNTLQGKPVFKLAIQGSGLRFFILVNGNNVLNQFDSESQVSTELPINQWMHPEETTFSIVAIPQTGHIITPGGSVSISLTIQDAEDGEVNYSLPILKLDTSLITSKKESVQSSVVGHYQLGQNNQVSFGSGEIVLGDISKIDYESYKGAYIYNRKVSIPNSLPLWAFFNSGNIPDYPSEPQNVAITDIESLFVKYKKVQDALVSGDIDSIMPMFAERNREGDLAFYYPSGTMETMLKASMVKFSHDPDWVTQIRKSSQVAIVREANKKLVSLYGARQSNVIGLVNKKDGRYNSYPMKFRREDGQWILTR